MHISPVSDHSPGLILCQVIESCMVGTRKPEPAIYDRVLKSLNVMPQNTVYLDDLEVNLKPARQLGMRTIKVNK